MHKAIALIVSVFVLTAVTIPQEVKHAHSLQSCEADLRLWASQLEGWPNPSMDQIHAGTKSLTFDELAGRMLSTTECEESYPILQRSKSGELSFPTTLVSYYKLEETERYIDVIVRHNLASKFKEEDQAAACYHYPFAREHGVDLSGRSGVLSVIAIFRQSTIVRECKFIHATTASILSAVSDIRGLLSRVGFVTR